MADDGKKEVLVTYETLFEMLRLEKSREELQKLDANFFNDVLSYLNEKRSVFQKKQLDLLNSIDAEKTRQQLMNIHKILKEIYDRREKKIVTMALNKAKTGTTLINTSTLLAHERELFDSLDKTLGGVRKDILCRLLNGEAPKECSQIPVQMSEQSDTSEQSASEPVQTEQQAPEMPEESNSVKLRFLEAIEEVVGPDLEIYGPFEANAEFELPREIAAVLVSKGQAETL